MTNDHYYCVGTHWNSHNPKNQLPRFIQEGVWENGYDDKFLETVNSIPAGSRLAAKTTYTKKEKGKSISVLEIHALGTVTENHQDGQTLSVKWDQDFKPFQLDGRGGYRSTISRVNSKENIRHIFENIQAANIQPGQLAALDLSPEDLTEDFPYNQILYGPPGTGKTYTTIAKALSIADGITEEGLSTRYPARQDLKNRFDELLIKDWDSPDGQIAFITFHQSFSYEDFIEGIKPSLDSSGALSYRIEEGIFKKLCKLASQTQNRSVTIDNESVTLSEELFKEIYDRFASSLTPANNGESNCKLKTKENYPFELFQNSTKGITARVGAEKKTWLSISYPELRKVLFENKTPVYKSYVQPVLDKILESQNYQEKASDTSKKRYVLIIDEINRGNISQIFGDLITLIEDDKRSGGKEHLPVFLPYSKEAFSVPSNLHIIGTMNTADRSVEALDTALRRRFIFEEKPPVPELLTPESIILQLWRDFDNEDWNNEIFKSIESELYKLLGFPEELNTQEKKEKLWGDADEEFKKTRRVRGFEGVNFTGVNLAKLLEAINKRVEKLLGRDHRIGHAYFLPVRSISALKKTFQNKVLPLLQEYFFGDYGRIGLVIGEAFITSAGEKEHVDLLTVPGYDSGDLNYGQTFHIQDVSSWDDEIFISRIKHIYGK